MLKEDTKKELISELVPMVHRRAQLCCFGESMITFSTGETKIWCQCSGEDQAEHVRKATERDAIEKLMVRLVSERSGVDVMIYPGTYSDVYFCECTDPHSIVLGVDCGGEIRDSRRYM